MTIARLGGRRFLLALLTLGACAALRAFDRLADASFVSVVVPVVLALIAGHTYENTRPAGTPAQPGPSGS